MTSPSYGLILNERQQRLPQNDVVTRFRILLIFGVTLVLALSLVSVVKTHVTSVGSSSITDDLSLRINVGSNAAVPNQANSFPSLNIPSGYYYLGTKVTSPEASAIVEPQGGCQRRCQDPHPGQFQTWNGQQNGCWIQVWRKWPDGCQHYQWYNSCNGYWDAYPNGAPKVFWTCCVHP